MRLYFSDDKLTSSALKRRNEEQMVRILAEAQFQTDDGGLRFDDLVKKLENLMVRGTVNTTAKRLEKKGVVGRKPVHPPEGSKPYFVYHVTKLSEKAYPKHGISREHYAELANRFDKVEKPGEFVSQLSGAITRDLIATWIASTRQRRKLASDDLECLLIDYDFLLKKFIYYRRYPDAAFSLKMPLRGFDEISHSPEKFEKQMMELELATWTGRSRD
jgi:predicted transcriptional regulator